MELFSTDSHFILVNGKKSLCINRRTSQFYSKSGCADQLKGALCLGLVHGLIGKVQFAQNSEPRLVFIRERSLIGKLKGCDIYQIKSVIAISMESDGDLLLEPCASHSSRRGEDNNVRGATGNADQRVAASNLVKVRPATLTTQAPDNYQTSPKKQERDDKVEKRMLDEFYKMFTDADSFYYSYEYDLTNTVQRDVLKAEKMNDKEKLPLWYGVDSRFFWNQYMLSELTQAQESVEPEWIIPIIQGFVQHQHCNMDHLLDPIGPGLINIHGSIDLWLISRRSRYRAGTRYLKRGIDENGNVANYVETEQIMVFKKHIISFVLTRGSVPLYWSQSGVRYRPLPRLERSSDENYTAFRQHIEEQGVIYGPVIMINLLDKSGKEKVLGDAFMENVLRHNSPELSYYTFDFHDNCRGMHFENVQTLIDKLDEQLRTMNYCWIDSYGIVQTQAGVCRVNCVDCLDRTNVVQSFLARHILCNQMCKLGLVSPEFGLPSALKKSLQILWANNGDTISKQYAGTSALKGDYTRTGERRFAGALKDGMNSANRYYLNRFRDATRQAVIDITLGTKKYVSEDELENEKQVEDKEQNTAEQLKAVIEDTQKCIVPKFDVVLGSWGLVNARENDSSVVDVDTILILTETAYYVTGYDCMLDSIATTEKVKLKAVTAIELGFEVTNQSPGIRGMFSSAAHIKSNNQIPSLRISYTTSGVRRFHQFRSSNMRFFNNVCVPISQAEEMLHALTVIADTIQIGASTQGNNLAVKATGRLSVGPIKAETKSESSPGNSWTQRYLNFNHADQANHNSGQKSMRLERSFEKFTPKYFRSSAAADAARRENAANEPGVTVTDVKVLRKDENEENRDEIATLSNIPDRFDLILPQLVVTPGFKHYRNTDLILPSCGLIAIPRVTFERTNYSFSPSFLQQYSTGHAAHAAANIVPPIYLRSLPQAELQLTEQPTDHAQSRVSSLQKHRCSLPTSSLTLTAMRTPRFGALTPVTPEIKITEEHLRIESGSLYGIPATPLRLSRSTEDVKMMHPNSASPLFHIPNMAGTHLRPICADTGRSTSDQDISASLANSLKGSHSESSIKAPQDPLQRFAPAKGNLQLRKDAVLAPLGKLANYFHPKKFKDSFKSQRKDGELVNVEDPEKLRILEERKQNCKSRIVEV